ncbi:helix-turn-helix domain-containing protein [Polaribacter sp. SA4-12]|uniref:helix-turn-helix domain-containing protein n=1 Tax=Polaribacter sp. SA4-12 TaxID=1312072 RepID=UPI000B3C47E4|nr:helix-turn-helix domain-containing protein [Polaribacter sp. SA4-12]ARV14148.1 hypothetical protein BTO07_02820 [Polaribacter sp. SA4-12]
MKNKKNHKPALQNTHVKFDPFIIKNEVWLNTEEAMKLLKVSRSTIYRLRKQKYIPSFQLGHIPIYPKFLLNKMLMGKALDNVNKT